MHQDAFNVVFWSSPAEDVATSVSYNSMHGGVASVYLLMGNLECFMYANGAPKLASEDALGLDNKS